MYLQFCKDFIDNKPLAELPAKYALDHLGKLGSLYELEEIAKAIFQQKDVELIKKGFYRLFKSYDPVTRPTVLDKLSSLYGVDIVESILDLEDDSEIGAFCDVKRWDEETQGIWALVKQQGDAFVWSWLIKDVSRADFLFTLLKNGEFEEFDYIVDAAKRVSKSALKFVINTHLFTQTITEQQYEATAHLTDLAKTILDTQEWQNYIAMGFHVGIQNIQSRKCDSQKLLALVNDLGSAAGLSETVMYHMRASIVGIAIANKLAGDKFGFSKKSKTNPRQIINETFAAYPEFNNVKSKGLILAGQDFRIGKILLEMGHVDYFLKSYLPALKRFVPQKYDEFLSRCVDDTALVGRFNVVQLKNFFEHLKSALSPDLFLEKMIFKNAEILRNACKDTSPETAEYILQSVYEQNGIDGLSKVFSKSRMFMAYDAGSLKVIGVLKKYAELTGDPSIRRQIIKNFRHDTFIGSKQRQRENNRKLKQTKDVPISSYSTTTHEHEGIISITITKINGKALAKPKTFELTEDFDVNSIEIPGYNVESLKMNLFMAVAGRGNFWRDDYITLASDNELRTNKRLLSDLRKYPKGHFNLDLYNEILPRIFLAVCLEGPLRQDENGKVIFGEHSINIIQVAAFMASMFENKEQVGAYIDKFILDSRNIFELAPPPAIPRSGNWYVKGWRDLLMQDYKLTLRHLKDADKLQEYIDSRNIPFPEKPEDLDVLFAAMYASKLDVIIRYDDLIQARRNLARYKLKSGFSFGLEEEFFGLKRSSFEPLKELMKHFSEDWVLKEDYGVTFDENVWVGYETNTPIIVDDNLTDSLLMTWILNNLRIVVNSSCSFHAHIGIDNNLKPEDRMAFLKQFTLNYIALEKDLSFLDHSLVNNYEDIFAKFGISIEKAMHWILAAKTPNDLTTATRPDSIGLKDPRDLSRMRSKLNFHALEVHKTLEVRHHVGTNRFMDVVSWLMFLDSLVYQTNQMLATSKGAHIPDAEEMHQLKLLVKDYVKMRGDKKIVNDQDLLPHQRDLMEGRFRKTDVAQAVV